MPSSTINIEFAKSSRPPVPLAYNEVRIPGTQARFRGRYALAPAISLQSFRRQAVIDWLDVGVILPAPSQAIHVKRMVDAALGGNCYVELLHESDAEGETRTGKAFAVRLQEPRIADVVKLEAALQDARRLEIPLFLRKMEVSIDFYPRAPSADARSQLFAVLHRHHWPHRDVLADRTERPRFSWGEGSDRTAAVLPIARTPGRARNLVSSASSDRAAFGDSTYYVGSRDGPVLWRIMDKEVDRQNRPAGKAQNLAESEKRVRIEVTLGSSELDHLGLVWPDDLARFRFEKLQSRYFAFMQPTFRRTGSGQPVPAWLERQRREKFLTSGVIGLRAMDEADAEQKAAGRRELIRHLRYAGRKPRPLRRTGTGSALTFVAYYEMNKAVETALRHLREREETEMRRVGVR
ncbi:hypothetical protein H9Q09_04930 [Aurantimonas sp. DM33-3]|uniref:hypothetical protein n=1 Tax=Aurantimonas sp. DM33-3 TaxID=2766955 RepID=UPI00165276A4|nr:hypothetical protein [Aurantimonas sp. DM33-3]MBC6715536.1 hypothetical protein [Aurantimonas sp. DM33-3]